ncbi:TolC family outer membrane protein [Propionivibrio limicola]|uniref:TolC family outer membrane protein n=1 Tax=Propionivibrio limicola TaxID=167645 RepID=UPI0012918C8E|nr:TolC family outer membrane protein [Propionivibrio limicola]
MRIARKTALAAALATLLAGPAHALDLKTAYESALVYDAEYLAARSARDEATEGVPVARAALLPQLSYYYQTNRAKTDTHYIESARPDTESGHYDSGSSAVSLRQALVRMPAWYSLQAAKASAGAADETFRNDTQRVGMRAVTAFLAVLAARETLEQTENHLKAMEAWLILAEKAFAAGRGTRTDIEDARARRDLSRAKVAETRMQLSAAEHNFEVIVGQQGQVVDRTDPLLLAPDLLRIGGLKDEWLQKIEDSNPEIESLRKQLEGAQATVAQMRSGHLPTIDLVATRQNSISDTNNSVGVEYTTTYVGVRVDVPLINGGGTTAQTSQARARKEKIQQTYESTRRKVLAEANRLLLAVDQGIEQTHALRQSIASAEQALIGEKKGLQAGTRTFVDVLDAERRYHEARRDHATAIFELANNRFKFLALAGGIEGESVESLNAWLIKGRR